MQLSQYLNYGIFVNLRTEVTQPNVNLEVLQREGCLLLPGPAPHPLVGHLGEVRATQQTSASYKM